MESRAGRDRLRSGHTGTRFMRFGILVAVVVVHITAFFWLGGRHEHALPPHAGFEATLLLLELPIIASRTNQSARDVKEHLSRRKDVAIARDENLPSSEPTVEAVTRRDPVDWALVAQSVASQWSESRGEFERAELAKDRCHKALFAPHQRASPFDFFHNSKAPGNQDSGGPVLFKISERCTGSSWLSFLGIGCSIGKIEARGDLFLHMRGPVQYGDWINVDPNPNAAQPSCEAMGTSPAMR